MKQGIKGWVWTGLIVALFFIGQARGQTRLYWENGEIIGTASQANVNSWYRDLPAYNSARSMPPSSASVSGGMVTLERGATLELGAGSGLGGAARVALRDVVTSPLSSIGKGMVLAARTNPVGVAASLAVPILLDAGIRYVNGQWMKDGTPEQAPNGRPYSSSLWWQYSYSGKWYFSGSREEACQGFVQLNNTGRPSSDQLFYMSVGYASNGRDMTCTFGFTVPGVTPSTLTFNAAAGCRQGDTENVSEGMCYPAGYAPAKGSAPATDTQIEGAMTQGVANHPQVAMDVLKSIYDNGGWVPLDVADSAGWTVPTTPVKGQPSSSTSNSTATNGDSITTTKTTTPTANVSTSGNTAGNNTVTVNVTNNTTTTTTNNTTGQTSTSTGTEDPPITFTDSSMPDVPKLYTQKYPDGIAGVWRDNKPNVQSTPFFQGVKSMFPSFGSGQCPVWSLSFNLGKAGNYGTRQFDVPCWIFQAVGLMMLVTATFTARKIIF